MDKEKIGITGAAGFVGKHFIEYLKTKGYEIRVLLNKTDIDDSVEKVYGDIRDINVLYEFTKNLDYVFHLASALGNRVISEKDFYDINVLGSENLIKSCIKNKVKRVVHFSSAGVYGKTSGIVELKETDGLNPIDIYEKTKAEGENRVLSFKEKIHVVVIRPGWIYGEGDKRTFKLIKQIYKGPFFIVGSGKVKHSPVYVKDLADASLQIMKKGKSGEIYNLSDSSMSVEDMIISISKALGKKRKFIKIPIALIYPIAFIMEKTFSIFNREAFINRSKLAFFTRGKPLDTSKIKNELGIKINRDFYEEMKIVVDWYKKNKWL